MNGRENPEEKPPRKTKSDFRSAFTVLGWIAKKNREVVGISMSSVYRTGLKENDKNDFCASYQVEEALN